MTQPMARIALVGDHSARSRAHARIPMLIDALLRRDGIALDAYWIATPDAEGPPLSLGTSSRPRLTTASTLST